MSSFASSAAKDHNRGTAAGGGEEESSPSHGVKEGEREHRVKKGETLFSLSVATGISVAKLKKLNRIYGNEIYEGQVLVLQPHSSVSSPSPNRAPPLSGADSSFFHQPNLTISRPQLNAFDDREDSSQDQQSIASVSSESANLLPERSPTSSSSSASASASSSASASASAGGGGMKKVGSSSALNNGNANSNVSGTGIAGRARFSLAALSDALQSYISTRSLSSAIAPLASGIGVGGLGFSEQGGSGMMPSEEKDALEEHPIPDPVLFGRNPILTVSQARQLRAGLPPQLQIENLVMLYNLSADGNDFNTFFQRVKGVVYTILVVKTVRGEVFGGFAGAEFKVSKDVYGSGESFLFKIGSTDDHVRVYPWSHQNTFFMYCSPTKIAMGGGEGDGFGFVLDADFASAQSNRCKTFDNDLLTEETGVVRISDVECWGFERHIKKRVHREKPRGSSPRSAGQDGESLGEVGTRQGGKEPQGRQTPDPIASS